MRLSFARFAVPVVMLMAVSFMTATADTVPVYDLTATAPPPVTLTPTPTGPPPLRREQPPTPVQPGRIYEGNYFGTPVEYLLDAELGQFFVIELTRADFDAVLEISDAQGSQVASDDDSGAGNLPQVIFIAPSTGTFTIKLRAFSDPQEGGYILSVVGTVSTLAFDEPVAKSIDGASSVIYSFEAEAGDVVNIVASSGDTVDTTLRLLGPDGVQVAYVDDFTGIDPEFRRQPLSTSGRYYLIHAPYSESATGDVTLSIEKTEIATLGAEPVLYQIEQGRDIFTVTVEAEQLYIVTLTSDPSVSGSFDITDPDVISEGSVNFSNVEGASMIFRPSSSGDYRLNVTLNTATETPTVGVYLSIMPIDE